MRITGGMDVEKLQDLLRKHLDDGSTKMSVAFMIGLDVIREIELGSLLNRVVRSIFDALSSVVGVEIIKGNGIISTIGNGTGVFKDFPLMNGYVLRVHFSDLNEETVEILRYVQALLSFHMDGVLRMERYKEMALKDPLTGVYTRSAGEEMLKKYSAMTKRGKKVSIIFVDLDDLKRINDTFGHEAGDEYIRFFASVALSSLREEDVVIRWGGDEFVLVLPGASCEDVEPVMERIKSKFDGSFSWGCSHMPDETEDPAEAVSIADERMYEMKRRKNSEHFLQFFVHRFDRQHYQENR